MDVSTTKTWTIPALLEESIRLQSILPPLFTWKFLLDSANVCNLGVYHRHPVLLDLYTYQFTPLVKKQYGSVEKYLIASLGTWNEVVDHEKEVVWNRNMETKIKLNDWGYALPREVKHWVIWVPIAVVHESNCNSNWTWDDISKQGLAGFTGLTTDKSKEKYKDLGGIDGPGKEISGFVKDNWKEEEFETIWYVNPPRLQSVRGLAHFHVLARPQTNL